MFAAFLEKCEVPIILFVRRHQKEAFCFGAKNLRRGPNTLEPVLLMLRAIRENTGPRKKLKFRVEGKQVTKTKQGHLESKLTNLPIWADPVGADPVGADIIPDHCPVANETLAEDALADLYNEAQIGFQPDPIRHIPPTPLLPTADVVSSVFEAEQATQNPPMNSTFVSEGNPPFQPFPQEAPINEAPDQVASDQVAPVMENLGQGVTTVTPVQEEILIEPEESNDQIEAPVVETSDGQSVGSQPQLRTQPPHRPKYPRVASSYSIPQAEPFNQKLKVDRTKALRYIKLF